MYWGYMTFNDDTEVTYSETKDDGTVGVWVETPIEGGFKSAHCIVPTFVWDSIDGFEPGEMDKLDAYVRRNVTLIMEMSSEKTFAGARGVA